WAWGLALHRQSLLTAGSYLSRVAWPTVATAALVTACGMLTKLTFVATIPATLMWLYWFARRRKPASNDSAFRRWAARAGGFLITVAALIAPRIARNLLVYGEPTGIRHIFELMHSIYWQRLGFPPDQFFSQFPVGEFVVRSF